MEAVLDRPAPNPDTEHIVPLEYPLCPGGPEAPEWVGWVEPEPAPEAEAEVEAGPEPAPAEPAPAPPPDRTAEIEAALRQSFEQRLAQETARSFEAGRERGRLEGREAERQAQAAAMAAADERRQRQAAELIEAFAEERDRYLREVEREVVDLALGIAARILRREAQMDPLLLTGAVRVALGQLSASTAVRLCVPAAELDLWTEAMALMPNLPVRPTVVPGEGLALGDCRIETELGVVDLGLRAQLGEIERGFFDRAGGRASAASKQEVRP